MVDHLLKHGDDLSFTSHFWKGCESNEGDLAGYSRFVQALIWHYQGTTTKQISEQLHVGPGSINSWIRFKRNSKLTDYLRALIRFGEPRSGWVWLSVNNTPGHAIPLGPFIQVPNTIGSWEDVRLVLNQVGPVRPLLRRFSRAYRFGFLLGIMIGDASKKRQAEWHRHLELVLSKKYGTNERIGNFMSECAHGVGIRMKRMPDQEAHGHKPHGFYVWDSQSSALVDWMFNVCLGLKDDELTTYNTVEMKWVTRAPEDFRRGLVQGMAESDGSVSIASQTVEFWIGPNWDFVRGLLLTFGVRSFRNREALSVTKREIGNLHRIPAFAPHLRTVRYARFEKLANARHIDHGTRIPKEIRESISEAAGKGMSNPEISEKILDEFGIVLSFEAVQRWAARTRSEIRGSLV